jgi:hypothetical protein
MITVFPACFGSFCLLYSTYMPGYVYFSNPIRLTPNSQGLSHRTNLYCWQTVKNYTWSVLILENSLGKEIIFKIFLLRRFSFENIILFGIYLTVFLASSWGCVNRIGRSYVTQGDRKIRDLTPLPPATVDQWRPWRERVPAFSRLHLSWAGIISYWPERAAHSQSEWRKPLPLRWWNRPGLWYVTNNFWLFFYIFKVFLQKYTLYKEKKISRKLIKEHI